MINSIKTIDIDNDFYNDYFNLINSFKKTHFTFDNFINFINNLPYNHDILILFDENTNKIIGTITVIIEKKLINNMKSVCHIEDLIISNTYRSKGYGRKILNIIKNYAREKNCYKIILDCALDLKEFYVKNGFENKNIQMSLYF